MHVTFVQPGKQYYVVNYNKDGGSTPSFFIDKIMPQARQEPIPVNQKLRLKRVVEREFVIENSVFEGFKQDNQEIIKQCFSYDRTQWKLNKFLDKN